MSELSEATWWQPRSSAYDAQRTSRLLDALLS